MKGRMKCSLLFLAFNLFLFSSSVYMLDFNEFLHQSSLATTDGLFLNSFKFQTK